MAEKDVSTRRDDLDSALLRGQIVQDLLGGTPAMQKAGKRYIAQRQGEPDAKHAARIAAAVLMNAYRRTVGYLSGQVFSKEVELGEEKDSVDAVFEAIKHDADLQGNNLTVWANTFFEDAINRGLGLLLVDYPMVNTRTEGGSLQYEAEPGVWLPKTAAADAKNGWRPYFVHISMADLLGWRFESVNGRRVLTQLRFLERVTVNKGQWDVQDVVVEQVRVLEPGLWQTWRKEKGQDGKEEWVLFDQGVTTIKEIPAAWFIPGERNGELAAFPALEDLAHLNRRHWQATAEQIELMGWVRSPGMYATGHNGEDALPWGPGLLTVFSDPNAKMGTIAVDATSVEAGRSELKDIEERMALYGLQLLMPETGDVTATAKALDAAESDSTLQRWAKLLADCLEQGMKYAAMWSGIDPEKAPGVEVNTDYHILAGLAAQDILLAVDKGIVPKRAAFEEFKRRGLQYDGDWQNAQAEIEQDARAGQSAPAKTLAAGILGNQGQQGA